MDDEMEASMDRFIATLGKLTAQVALTGNVGRNEDFHWLINAYRSALNTLAEAQSANKSSIAYYQEEKARADRNFDRYVQTRDKCGELFNEKTKVEAELRQLYTDLMGVEQSGIISGDLLLLFDRAIRRAAELDGHPK